MLGAAPGEFNCPHSLVIHPDGERVIVADRENSRVQTFSLVKTAPPPLAPPYSLHTIY